MTTQTEALKLADRLLDFASEVSADFDTTTLEKAADELRRLDSALAQPEQEKERCVGCEACIDTACGRDECPKGWPKAAQPEQEPMAWMRHDGARVTTAADRENYPDYETRYSIPLYTEPPQRTWVGLTDEEIEMIVENRRAAHWEFVRQVEAKLKEKNT